MLICRFCYFFIKEIDKIDISFDFFGCNLNILVVQWYNCYENCRVYYKVNGGQDKLFF